MSLAPWEEVGFHVLSQQAEQGKKIDKVDEKVGDIEKKFEVGMAVITQKLITIMWGGSLAIGTALQIATHLLGLS